jgi:hypothetical protein
VALQLLLMIQQACVVLSLAETPYIFCAVLGAYLSGVREAERILTLRGDGNYSYGLAPPSVEAALQAAG